MLPRVNPQKAERDGTWRDNAACRDQGPTLFFPQDDYDRIDPAALDFCRRCPVVDDCLSYALDARELYGVYGGTTPRQRREMLRRRVAARRRERFAS